MTEAELHEQFQKSQSTRLDLSSQFSDFASVAVIIKNHETAAATTDLEVGYIIRAENPNDRWSGHIAFPGGRREPIDKNDLDTAIRETKEEIGLDLTTQNHIGSLSDVQARKKHQMLPFFLKPHVFSMSQEVFNQQKIQLHPDEVADLLWIRVADIIKVENQTEYETEGYKLPAIQFPKNKKLWGLTYLLTLDLLKRLGLSVPVATSTVATDKN